MERFDCRFCFKSFINGRALGGHMKSHMLPFSTKHELYELEEEIEELPSQLNTESDASSSSSDHKKFDTLKTNRLVNDELEFDFAESSRIQRRSKRTRKLGSFDFDFKKRKTRQLGESASSASDTTTEEDLAFCLIMLSRDKWKVQKKTKNQTLEEEDDESDYKTSKNRGRFKCETCGKVFKSYQALGGHRASHKKNKTSIKTEQEKLEYDDGVKEKRIHECPVCFRVFSSGQALGGHKRSHGSNIGVSVKQRLIDLNLPASTQEDVFFKKW